MAWEKFEYARTNTVLRSLIMIMDEYAEFADLDSLPNNMRQKVYDIQAAVQSIARLGRSAHIHIIIATQSSTGNLFPASLKNNVQMRQICGRVDGNVSRMAIDTEEGESVPTSPGAYLGWCKGDTLNYQGWYTKPSDVLAMGTIKEGYDPKTGKKLGEEGFQDFSNLPTYQEPTPQASPAENITIDSTESAIVDEPPTNETANPPAPESVPAPIDVAAAPVAAAVSAVAPQPEPPQVPMSTAPIEQTPGATLEDDGLIDIDLNAEPTPTQPAADTATPITPPPQPATAASKFNIIGTSNPGVQQQQPQEQSQVQQPATAQAPSEQPAPPQSKQPPKFNVIGAKKNG